MAGSRECQTCVDQSGFGEAASVTEPPCYDVFISYSSLDKVWVRGELLKRIEQAGLKAFIDFRDFKGGAPSIKEMERGVVTCTKTLLVLTPDYIESEWCEIENIMAAKLSPANRDLRLIPLLKTECSKPPRIAALTHVDFTDGADLDLAWRQLLTALGAPPVQEPPREPKRGRWFLAHPYPMPANFTGRVVERKLLSHWLDEDNAHPLLVLRALGGFGKSALVWHWLLHDVSPTAWPQVVWWSFYEADASFDSFLSKALHYVSDGKITMDKASTNDMGTLLEWLRSRATLLILDGFERELRGFAGLNAPYQGDTGTESNTNERDCISPVADQFLYHVSLQPDFCSKVLLTSRYCPHVLEAKGGGLLQGCWEEELLQMQPADAVEFFLAQGVRGRRAEIQDACKSYGYHPLSLRLLAGWIVGDLQEPGDIAAANRLDVSGTLVQRQHHVLEQAYGSLTPPRKSLLGRIACFRSGVTYDDLKAVAEKSATTLDVDLRDLVARGLLHHDTKERRFDLHPIVRRYAYAHLNVSDRTAAHTRLRDYFATKPLPDRVTRLEDLNPLIELYHHTVRAGQYDQAKALYRAHLEKKLYHQFCAYRLIIDLLRALFPDGEDHPPRLKYEGAQAWTLNELANTYGQSGQPGRSVALFERHNMIRQKLGHKEDLATGLGNVAFEQMLIGALRIAEGNLRRRITLCQKITDESGEAIGHQELGRLLAYCGDFAESKKELALAKALSDKRDGSQVQSVVCAYCSLRELLRLRSACSPADPSPARALDLAQQALDWANETARTKYPHELDYVRAHWLKGAAYRIASQWDEADSHLREALERCRRINCVEAEADILIDLARVRANTASSDEAQRLAEEALLITERSGYVLQGADAHLELGRLALAHGDDPVAFEHAGKARELAFCDGPPDYTYKAAYDEAGALLQGQQLVIHQR